MTTLAIVYLVLWVVTSLVFEFWRHTVMYPKRPLRVAVLNFTWEVVGIALAFAVIFR